MNSNNITVQECIDLYQDKGLEVIINDGNVVGFSKCDDNSMEN